MAVKHHAVGRDCELKHYCHSGHDTGGTRGHDATAPGMHGMIVMTSHACTPPGWSYDPSSWKERLPIVALAAVGAAIATYLTLFQVGMTADVWEPFFGDGSRTVLTSSVSRVLPVPDAALGAAGYVLDAISGVVGGRGRWRTTPWIVVLFGLAVGPLGAVSVLLVILQPLLFNAWCTLCLASAVISVIMIGPAMDELLASLQHLARVGRRGGSRWRAFWGLDHYADADDDSIDDLDSRSSGEGIVKGGRR